jgi:hypothetical protein
MRRERIPIDERTGSHFHATVSFAMANGGIKSSAGQVR